MAAVRSILSEFLEILNYSTILNTTTRRLSNFSTKLKVDAAAWDRQADMLPAIAERDFDPFLCNTSSRRAGEAGYEIRRGHDSCGVRKLAI